MAEENKMTRRGLGGKGRDPEPTVPKSEENQTVVTTKPPTTKHKKQKTPPIIPILLVAILSFGAVGAGALVWKILHDSQEKLAQVAAQSLQLRGTVDEITKEIPKARSLESLNSLNLKANEAIRGLEALKETAKSIGDEETSKNIDSDLAKIKPIPAQIQVLVNRESKAQSAINDIAKSVQPLKDTEKLSCDQLRDAPNKFDEAIAKLSNPKNVPVEAFANAEARKLVTDYINFKAKALSLTSNKCPADLNKDYNNSGVSSGTSSDNNSGVSSGTSNNNSGVSSGTGSNNNSGVSSGTGSNNNTKPQPVIPPLEPGIRIEK